MPRKTTPTAIAAIAAIQHAELPLADQQIDGWQIYQITPEKWAAIQLDPPLYRESASFEQLAIAVTTAPLADPPKNKSNKSTSVSVDLTPITDQLGQLVTIVTSQSKLIADLQATIQRLSLEVTDLKYDRKPDSLSIDSPIKCPSVDDGFLLLEQTGFDSEEPSAITWELLDQIEQRADLELSDFEIRQVASDHFWAIPLTTTEIKILEETKCF